MTSHDRNAYIRWPYSRKVCADTRCTCFSNQIGFDYLPDILAPMSNTLHVLNKGLQGFLFFFPHS